jgi:alkylation response protein AidB-like acyl-CoA dehydrogenase
VGRDEPVLGRQLTGFAVVLQVYDRTRSPVAVGAIGVAQMVSALMMGLLGARSPT